MIDDDGPQTPMLHGRDLLRLGLFLSFCCTGSIMLVILAVSFVL